MFSGLANDQDKLKYELYQKEAQIIETTSTASRLYVSLPAMLPNFVMIGMNEVQNMSYQLKSFRFDNTFKNVLKTYFIRMRITTQWRLTTSYVDHVLPDVALIMENDISQNIPMSLATKQPIVSPFYDADAQTGIMGTIRSEGNYKDSLATASEIVDRINMQMLHIIENELNSGDTFRSEMTATNINLLAMVWIGQFIYDAGTGKLGFQFSRNAPRLGVPTAVYNGNVPNPINDMPNIIMSGDAYGVAEQSVQADFSPFNAALPFQSIKSLDAFSIEITPLETLSSKEQTAIARLLGLPSGMQTSTYFGTPVSDTTVPLYHEMYRIDPLQYSVITTQQAAYTGDPMEYNFTATNDTEVVTYNFINVPTVSGIYAKLQSSIIYGSIPMITSKHRLIRIHTSLNTSKWNADGSQSDILETIPITGDQLSIGQVHANVTRIYQTKDQNMRTFTLEFKDENGDFIVFENPYTIQIAWFFTK